MDLTAETQEEEVELLETVEQSEKWLTTSPHKPDDHTSMAVRAPEVAECQ